EEWLGLGVYGAFDSVVKGLDAMLGQLGVGDEIAGQVFGDEGPAFLPEVIKRPEEAFGGVAVDFDGVLDLPLVVAEADEDEMPAIGAHAEERIELVAALRAHGVKPRFDLLDDFLRSG